MSEQQHGGRQNQSKPKIVLGNRKNQPRKQIEQPNRMRPTKPKLGPERNCCTPEENKVSEKQVDGRKKQSSNQIEQPSRLRPTKPKLGAERKLLRTGRKIERAATRRQKESVNEADQAAKQTATYKEGRAQRQQTARLDAKEAAVKSRIQFARASRVPAVSNEEGTWTVAASMIAAAGGSARLQIMPPCYCAITDPACLQAW